MKNQLKSIIALIFCLVFLSDTIYAQVNVTGKWKIVKYDAKVTVKDKSATESKELSEEYFYEFKDNKAFTGNAWFNPFRGGFNKSEMKGSYGITGNEIKITCKKDDDNKNSYFYYDLAIENEYLVLFFDKNKLIRWFKDSDNPNDAFAKQLSENMFSAIDCKIYLQKVQ